MQERIKGNRMCPVHLGSTIDSDQNVSEMNKTASIDLFLISVLLDKTPAQEPDTPPQRNIPPMGKSPASYPPAVVLSDAQANLNLFFYVNSPQEFPCGITLSAH
ncbi:hypothetical protein C6H68_05840 [Photorhabdus luminescens]|nr:hypothetical protein C6H68_05840 [Photorhabdus luminescens]